MFDGQFLQIFIVALIVIIVFLFIREIVIWYLKQNKIVSTLKKIEGHLDKLASQGRLDAVDTNFLKDSSKVNAITQIDTNHL